ncbi:hypothetical protein H8K90_08305 [Winogradskyella echinorum]|uniref:Uncharacterized protein n=1 Tax=Winogradskyella echinorum TaxID=538189 RepID=A0ABR6Y2B4_9FLAO|nr:hypothetical protein [Winogradskyella echinorum]MBC3846378.1 hypothetical protein [Winogradskyella echinorum]MBC5750726.1 hypothetical protein [Winogradskyella echinorum]
MKNIIIIVMLLLHSVVAFSQDENRLEILEADSTWLKEIIKFPLSFAEDIKYKGYEDLRFAKNWSQPEGTEFFTYAFVWNINLSDKPTVEMIESNTKLYYDGLMSAVNKDKDLTIPKSVTTFNLIDDIDEKLPFFSGEMKVYDSFFTKKVITLFARVESIYCEKQNKYLLLFRVSSLEFNKDIWNVLNNITLSGDACEVNTFEVSND